MTEGLRARKKQRTRQALSDAATALFAERGFDAVTTAQIAAAADVAVGTVFNYFKTKEELFFDRVDALIDDLGTAIAERPAGMSAVAAFRGWHEREIAFLLDPRGAEATRRFFRTIEASPSLQAAEHLMHQRIEAALVAALRDGTPPADPTPDVLGAVLLALHRTVVNLVRALTLGGSTGDETRARATRATELAFAALAKDTHTWGTRRRAAGRGAARFQM